MMEPNTSQEMILDHHLEDTKNIHIVNVNHDHHIDDRGANSSYPPQPPMDLFLDDQSRQAILDLQRHWVNDYQQSREKLLVEMTERLHQEFLSDQQKIRTDLLTQFKDELDSTRMDLETKYRETLKVELNKVSEKHRREISAAKRKQWCFQCENEAIYHCCWNTAYCSVECQQAHWTSHRRNCRRQRNNQRPQQPAGPNGQ